MLEANPPYIVVAKLERKSYSAPLWQASTTEEDVSMYDANKFAKLTFTDAEPVFLAYKRTRVKADTIACYEMYLKHLRVHFAEKRLCEISIADIHEYQALRVAGQICPPDPPRTHKRGRVPTHKAGASLVNHELNALAQMMEKAGQWDRIAQWYSPVEQQEPDPPKTMTPEEEERFFRTAARNPDWSVAYWVGSLTNNTSAAGCEIRNLRLGDIDLQGQPPKFGVPKGKNKIREKRPIVLNDTAYKQMCRIVQRAVGLGAHRPEHYVFPFRVKRGVYDLNRPATKSWLKKQWAALVVSAGVPWLKPHNLRFQCATRLRAAGVAGETIRKQFGWRNLKMLEHYNRPSAARCSL